jgi:DNA-binding XRE family transcriptional regulator
MTEVEDESLDVTVGANIKQCREQLGLSQGQVARLVGMGFKQQTIVKIEKGDRPLKLSEAIRVAEVLSVEVKDLYESQGSFQLQGIFRTVRDLYESVRQAAFELEDWRLALIGVASALEREGRTFPESFQDGLERYSRDDLVELAVAEARDSEFLRMSRKARGRG